MATPKRVLQLLCAVVLISGATTTSPSTAFSFLNHTYAPPSPPSPPAEPSKPIPAPPPASLPPQPSLPPVAPVYKGIKGGYWPSWLATGFPPPTIPTQYFTDVFYAFVSVDASTYQLSITELDDQLMANFTATLHTKTPPAKAYLSIGGSTTISSTFSSMVNNSNNRMTFIKSTITVARKYAFDGLDLNWEFPSTPQDMSNLALLFQDWGEALQMESFLDRKPQLLLSIAVYFASSFFVSGVPRSYPGDAITKYVDSVKPMCFDYHGSWDTSITGEHALLYDKTSNISTSFGLYSWIKAGVPREKLVMGLPLYGRTWKLKDPSDNGIGAPAVGVGPGDHGVMLYHAIVDYNLVNRTSHVYDEDTVSEYTYAGTDRIGYDGPQSLVEKINFAKADGLGGYFLWAIGFDENWALSEIASSTWEGKY